MDSQKDNILCYDVSEQIQDGNLGLFYFKVYFFVLFFFIRFLFRLLYFIFLMEFVFVICNSVLQFFSLLVLKSYCLFIRDFDII